MTSNDEFDPIVDAKVLLVEDSRDHQYLFIKRIKEAGIDSIMVFETGEDAIRKIKEGTDFNLVIVDYSLPGKSGIEVIEEIRHLNREIPIIMITGLGSERIAVQAMKLGVQDYLTKEEMFEPDNLKQTITQVLLEHRARQETVLAQQLAENPEQLSVSVFKFGKIGPEPFLTSRLPFEDSITDVEKENFLIKIGTYYMSATGAGHDYARGLFELPVPNYEKYRGLVYAFQMVSKDFTDKRIRNTIGANYGLVVVLFPVLFRSVLPNRATIEKQLDELLGAYSTMEELNENFLDQTRKIFMTPRL
jgi:CheY-like chemotaxis protein